MRTLAGPLVVPTKLPLLQVALVFGSLLLPLGGTFNCAEGWPRSFKAIFTAAMAAFGIAGVTVFWLAVVNTGTDRLPLKDGAMVMIAICVLGAAFSGWVSNYLAIQRPKR